MKIAKTIDSPARAQDKTLTRYSSARDSGALTRIDLPSKALARICSPSSYPLLDLSTGHSSTTTLHVHRIRIPIQVFDGRRNERNKVQPAECQCTR